MCSNERMMEADLGLETARVRLAPLGAMHLSDLRRNANDPALWEFTFHPNPFDTQKRAEQWLREALAPGNVAFAIVDKESNEAIGSTRYFDIHAEHRKLEIAEAFRSILAQSTADEARTRAVVIIDKYGTACSKAMQILAAGLDDALAFYAFPAVHRRKLWSSNPIEHLNVLPG